jgi:lambda family phage portal protein
LNVLDSVIAAFSPARAVKRAYMRSVLARYEGGRSTKRNKKSRDNSTGERIVVRDAATVRATMRDLERNHDLVRGALLNLTRNVIGPKGVSIEPHPRIGGSKDAAGYDSIHDGFARDLLAAWREWTIAPEVTRTLDWVQVQELVFRTVARDGEAFAQVIEGSGSFLRHASRVPLSLELLEADVVPLDYQRTTPLVDAGIERNEWGQVLAYYMHKHHPGNGGGFVDGDLKRVPAERVLHLAVRERLSGLRGISLFASCIDRLLDIKNYEQDEQMAARIAARITAYVKRDVNMDGWAAPTNEDGTPAEREFMLEAGALFTDLAPGEEIQLVNPNRPNSGLEKFRMALVRAASRAVGLSYSTFAGDYDGTYSAQRQELVESYDSYRMLTHHFVARFVRPVWERFVTMAIASGQVKVPEGVRPETVAWADFRGPRMPWIDPGREANAMKTLARTGVESLQQQIADRGGRLQDVFEQIKRERDLAAELGLILESDARYTSASGITQARPEGSEFPDRDNESAARTRSRGDRSRLNGHGDMH